MRALLTLAVLAVAAADNKFLTKLPALADYEPSSSLSSLLNTSSSAFDGDEEVRRLRRARQEAAARFRRTFAFLRKLDGGRRRYRVHFSRRPDGDYTGEQDGRGVRHGWGEMVWAGRTPGRGQGDRYVGQWQDDKEHGECELALNCRSLWESSLGR